MQSGVGTGGKPRDTPFGLYRDGTELRAVYYDKPEVATSACLSLGLQCDYPILLGEFLQAVSLVYGLIQDQEMTHYTAALEENSRTCYFCLQRCMNETQLSS